MVIFYVHHFAQSSTTGLNMRKLEPPTLDRSICRSLEPGRTTVVIVGRLYRKRKQETGPRPATGIVLSRN